MGAETSASKSCPSTRCTPGAILLGVLGEDGRIHNMRTAMTIDEDFVEMASRSGPPEARMRFAGTCQTSACSQWTGDRCGVIDKVLGFLGPQGAQEATLMPCVIRGSCRWYSQTGAEACSACSFVVTDQSGTIAAE